MLGVSETPTSSTPGLSVKISLLVDTLSLLVDMLSLLVDTFSLLVDTLSLLVDKLSLLVDLFSLLVDKLRLLILFVFFRGTMKDFGTKIISFNHMLLSILVNYYLLNYNLSIYT
jgi:hypothetical protein